MSLKWRLIPLSRMGFTDKHSSALQSPQGSTNECIMTQNAPEHMHTSCYYCYYYYYYQHGLDSCVQALTRAVTLTTSCVYHFFDVKHIPGLYEILYETH